MLIKFIMTIKFYYLSNTKVVDLIRRIFLHLHYHSRLLFRRAGEFERRGDFDFALDCDDFALDGDGDLPRVDFDGVFDESLTFGDFESFTFGVFAAPLL